MDYPPNYSLSESAQQRCVVCKKPLKPEKIISLTYFQALLLVKKKPPKKTGEKLHFFTTLKEKWTIEENIRYLLNERRTRQKT